MEYVKFFDDVVIRLDNQIHSKNDSSHSYDLLIIESYKTLLLLLSPFAPHLCEELWQLLNKTDTYYKSIHNQLWPNYKDYIAALKLITIVIQIDGKKRAEIQLNP